MKLSARVREVEARTDKPKSLKVTLILDPETGANLQEMAINEGLEVTEMMRTLVIGAMSAYPKWGIEAADRRRAFADQQEAILTNLYAWFAEQRWIMEQQIADIERSKENGR